MTSVERNAIAAMTRKARAIRDTWLLEREEALAVRITANDEVRKGWRASDHQGEKQSVKENSGDPRREHTEPRTGQARSSLK